MPGPLSERKVGWRIWDYEDVTGDHPYRAVIVMSLSANQSSSPMDCWLGCLVKGTLAASLVKVGHGYEVEADLQQVSLVKGRPPAVYLRVNDGGNTRNYHHRIYEAGSKGFTPVFEIQGGMSMSTTQSFEMMIPRFEDRDGDGTKEIVVNGVRGQCRTFELEGVLTTPHLEFLSPILYRWRTGKFVPDSR